MKSNYVYILEYENSISTEGYDSEDKAIARLEKQGYKQMVGYLFTSEQDGLAKIRCIKIV